MTIDLTQHTALPDQRAVLTKAVLRASERLGVTGKGLAMAIGVSEATLSRMKNGAYTLEANTKPFELSVLFVRLFRSLDAIVGGDAQVARAWLNNGNEVLGDRPAEKIQTIVGLMDVIDYLDARRALV